MKHYVFSHLVISCLIFLLLGQSVLGNTTQHPLEPPGTSSPRATLKIFMDTINMAYRKHLYKRYEHAAVMDLITRAGQCLDLSEVAPT
jgi:MscS family membrane protein